MSSESSCTRFFFFKVGIKQNKAQIHHVCLGPYIALQVQRGISLRTKDSKQNTVTKATGPRWRHKGPPPLPASGQGQWSQEPCPAVKSHNPSVLQHSSPRRVQRCTRFLCERVPYRAACTFSNLNSTTIHASCIGLPTSLRSGKTGFIQTFTCDQPRNSLSHFTYYFLE